MKLVVVSGHRRFDKHKNFLRRLVRALDREFKQQTSYLEVFLVGKEFMEKNVLAFPAPKGFPHPDTNLKPLGEIYLNPDYIRKNKEGLGFMFVHGFLHLLGYDHKKENDRIKMEKREAELIKKLLKNEPYSWIRYRLTQHKSGSRRGK